jgi:hypothetical protein
MGGMDCCFWDTALGGVPSFLSGLGVSEPMAGQLRVNVVATGKVVGVAVLAAECRAVWPIEEWFVSPEVFAPSQGLVGSALRGRACFWGT